MKKLVFALMASILIVNTTLAAAGPRAQSVLTNTTTSAKWAVAAVAEGQTPSAQPLMLTWNVSGGTAYQYFSFKNIGTTTINNFAVSISQTVSTQNGKTNDVFFERCLNGTWDLVANTCSGAIILVGKATDLIFSFTNASLPENAGISMRARTPPNNRNAYVTTISTSVSRLDIRSALVTHS